MNIYFLVEGRRTEFKVYPKWLSHLLPELTRVEQAHLAQKNNFFIFSGQGYPSILHNHLRNSVDDVNEFVVFNYLVLCIDSDEETVEQREIEVLEFIKKEEIELNENTELILIIQNRCFETWFLGNRKIFKNNPQSKSLKPFIKFYNVKKDDPELMGKLETHATHAQFHSAFLRELLSEKNIEYTKANPKGVMEEHFLNELIKRSYATNHIQTFKSFIDFCNKIKNKIN